MPAKGDIVPANEDRMDILKRARLEKAALRNRKSKDYAEVSEHIKEQFLSDDSRKERFMRDMFWVYDNLGGKEHLLKYIKANPKFKDQFLKEMMGLQIKKLNSEINYLGTLNKDAPDTGEEKKSQKVVFMIKNLHKPDGESELNVGVEVKSE